MIDSVIVRGDIKSALRAVFAVCVMLVVAALSAKADGKKLLLVGHIQEALGKTDLMKGYAVPIDADGNPGDTLRAGILSTNAMVTMMSDRSVFGFQVERKDSTYVFEIGCDGYLPQTLVYKVENVGKRENRRDMPVTYLERAPHKLKEVTVTASKIKFYNRGDTIVYNADAFQLAEGSMLDGLIAQLPGVELNSDGQIKVNGEFVESLLLNGREFFDGNNNLMLKNLAAYTVKNVEVYRGQSFSDKWRGDLSAPKRLTMDVKLKKEYDMGWLVNAQAGYGTEDRYIGRLFGMWFNRTTQVMLVSNLNNLNDSREPGKNDSWRPELMPSGRMRYQLAGISYNYASQQTDFYASGNATYEGNRMDSRTFTDRTNFYADRNTYEYSQSDFRNKSMRLRASHSLGQKVGVFRIENLVNGGYSRVDRKGQSLSGSFDSEQYGMSLQALEAIYSDGTDSRLKSVINLNRSLSDSESKEGNVDGKIYVGYSVPRTSDRVYTEFRVAYDDKKETLWNDYNVKFGPDGPASIHRRNYTDDSPNNDLRLYGQLGYDRRGEALDLTIKYTYNYHSRKQDSYMYTLDRLADMGIYGTLPAGYVSAFDAANSFTSTLIENTHTISPTLRYSRGEFGGSQFSIDMKPELSLLHSHFNYFSDGRFYPVRRTSFLAVVPQMSTGVRYSVGNRMKGENMYVLMYHYDLTTDTPDLLHMVDVTNTSDPLNIMLGNPDLKNAYRHHHNVSLRFFSGKHRMQDFIDVDYSPVTNSLVRGYCYDMSTGIRRNRTYNVRGEYAVGVKNSFTLFAFQGRFGLSSVTEATRIHSIDMIGLNVDEPLRSTVNTRNLSENLNISWQIGNQTISLKGVVTNRRTTSAREGFSDINATHLTYGVDGQFKLPAGFGISTDFNLYTRRGYGVKELDTTDAVWNARVTYTPRGGRWVFTVDGFDLLHRLSNVHYAVTASGRTVTYTNTLPRYILASVQYRFSVQPKKR